MTNRALLEIVDEAVLAAFAAVMLGRTPLDPPSEAVTLARLATGLASSRRAPRPGDVQTTRAFRSVYSLTREQAALVRANRHPDDRSSTKTAALLDAALHLRHRQRASLALRYIFGLPEPAVARVLGVSRRRVAEIIRAGTANASAAAGGRIDVPRRLRAIGVTVRDKCAPKVRAKPRGEPRPVVKLLLSSLGEARPSRVGPSGLIATPAPHPVYRVRAPRPLPDRPPAPPTDSARAKPRRLGLILAASVAALAFLGAFAPAALLRQTGPVPLAAVPLAPVLHEAAPPAAGDPAAPAVYDVRSGDTLWSIAGDVLGDSTRWRELWRSNAGKIMSDGARFRDPDLIVAGWRLRVPTG